MGNANIFATSADQTGLNLNLVLSHVPKINNVRNYGEAIVILNLTLVQMVVDRDLTDSFFFLFGFSSALAPMYTMDF